MEEYGDERELLCQMRLVGPFFISCSPNYEQSLREFQPFSTLFPDCWFNQTALNTQIPVKVLTYKVNGLKYGISVILLIRLLFGKCIVY